MLKVVDVGVAYMTKRDKADRYYGLLMDAAAPNDQDAYVADRSHNCYAVADGVGSSMNAAVAARAACDEFQSVVVERFADPPLNMTERDLAVTMLDRVQVAAMGSLALTTFTGLVIHEDPAVSTASYLHVGDSQLMLLRNHNLIHLTSEQVHDNGFWLFNYLGIPPDWDIVNQGRRMIKLTAQSQSFSEEKTEAEWGSLYIQGGDRFALVTDGIVGSDPYQRLSNDALKQSMYRWNDASACATELLERSKKIDDSTVVIVDIG